MILTNIINVNYSILQRLHLYMTFFLYIYIKCLKKIFFFRTILIRVEPHTNMSNIRASVCILSILYDE